MRPVNLLPPELRARTAGEGDPKVAYGVLAGLGVLLVMVLLAVYYSNQATTLNDQAAALRAEAQRRQANVKPVESFNDFADVVHKRTLLVGGLAESRFPWDVALKNLANSMPEDVTLDDINATTSATVEGDGSANAATLDLKGCVSSWVGMSRFMVRMRNLPGVKDVVASESDNSSEDSGNDSGEGSDSSGSTESAGRSKNCGLAPVKFGMKVIYEPQTVDLVGLPSAGGGAGGGATGSTGATATPASAPAPADGGAQ